MELGLKRNVVKLANHDPMWANIAAETIRQLQAVFGSVAEDIQHVGSTSIRHIQAKPIIDIAVAIHDFAEVVPLYDALERAGFSNRGWFMDNHMIFTIGYDVEPNDRVTTHFIHIVKADSTDWYNNIHFRDYLNANPAVAKAYETLKIGLAQENPYDPGRERYVSGKDTFIKEALQDAAKWLESRQS